MVFKPAEREMPEGMIPESFSLDIPDRETDDFWWKEFNSRELEELIEIAFTNNLSLEKAWARLEQARAAVTMQGSSLVPGVEASAGNTWSKQNTDDGTVTSEGYSLALACSYELDLWGRLRAERNSTRLEFAATMEDLNTAAISLASEIATVWLNIISQRRQIEILQKQLETNKMYLELMELRFNKSMASVLDVYQQRQAVDRIKAEIPAAEAAEKIYMHSLALLLGRPPKACPEIKTADFPSMNGLPPAGIPAGLLETRPDIRAAQYRLQAADWSISAARADRLPSIRLSASAGYSSDKMSSLFDNWILSLANEIVAPIIDGKHRAAEVTRAKAEARAYLADYRSTVLTAIREVEDSLVRETKQDERIKLLEEQASTARKALDEAHRRYTAGLNDYLPVLLQALETDKLERSLISEKASLLIYRIALYKSLGGTWTSRLGPDGINNKAAENKE